MNYKRAFFIMTALLIACFVWAVTNLDQRDEAFREAQDVGFKCDERLRLFQHDIDVTEHAESVWKMQRDQQYRKMEDENRGIRDLYRMQKDYVSELERRANWKAPSRGTLPEWEIKYGL